MPIPAQLIPVADGMSKKLWIQGGGGDGRERRDAAFFTVLFGLVGGMPFSTQKKAAAPWIKMAQI